MNKEDKSFFAATDKVAGLLFLILCAVLITLLAQMFMQKRWPVIEADLLALFDYKKQNPVLDKAIKHLQQNAQNKVIIGFSSKEKEAAQQAAEKAQSLLQSSSTVNLHSLQNTLLAREKLIDTLKQQRQFLITAQQRQILEQSSAQQLDQQTLKSLYGMGQTGLLRFAEDPLSVFQNFVLNSLPAPGNASIEEDFLYTEDDAGLHYYFLNATVNGNPLDLTVQENFFREFNLLLTSFQNSAQQDVQVLYSGVIFHAGNAAQQAKRELAVISVVSVLSIVTLFFFCFRSLSQLLLGLSSITFGCLSALLLCTWLFHSIHLITLVFGASLIGVSIDYALHYFAFHSRDNAKAERPAHLYPALLFSLISTLAAYACLFKAPLPGLQQMAFFAISGLVSAWLFVLTLYPRLQRRKVFLHSFSLQCATLFLQGWKKLSPKAIILLFVALTLVCAVLLSTALHFNAEARAMYQPPEKLLRNDKAVNTLLNNISGSQFIFVHASSLEEALQKEESFIPSLLKVFDGNIIALSHLLPSQQQQQENQALLQSVYADSSQYQQTLQQLGMTEQAIKSLQQAYGQHAQQNTLTLDSLHIESLEEYRLTLLNNPKEQEAKEGIEDSFKGTLILLSGNINSEAVQTLLMDFPDIELVDQIQSLGSFLQEQIHSTLKLLAFAYLAVSSLIYLLYRQGKALALVAIPGLSSLLTLSVLTLLQVDISLFHLFGLFLVLGLGMDYSIFLSHYRKEYADTLVAILLSATTSCLSFGLLAYSTTPMIAHFGLTVLIGSLFNLGLAPLVTFLRIQAR